MRRTRYYRPVKISWDAIAQWKRKKQAAIGFAVIIVAAAMIFGAEQPSKESQIASASEFYEDAVLAPKPILKDYIEIISSCGPNYDGECLNVRSGPGTEYPAVAKMRNGAVLRVSEMVSNEEGSWYKITFDEWLRYPERQSGDRYIAAAYVRAFSDVGSLELNASPPAGEAGTTPTNKRIIVDRSDQTLYAYDGDTPFMEQQISTGLDLTPTPRGTFPIYRKTPSRYMQGPIPGISDQEYDLPGVPWNLYFTLEGAVIHGAYWHDSFGQQWSHGCVNLPPQKAKELYEWAELGALVTVRD